MSRIPDTLAVSWCDRQSGSPGCRLNLDGNFRAWTVGVPES